MYVSFHKACVWVIRVEKTVIWLRTHYIKANIFAVHEYDKSATVFTTDYYSIFYR